MENVPQNASTVETMEAQTPSISYPPIQHQREKRTHTFRRRSSTTSDVENEFWNKIKTLQPSDKVLDIQRSYEFIDCAEEIPNGCPLQCKTVEVHWTDESKADTMEQNFEDNLGGTEDELEIVMIWELDRKADIRQVMVLHGQNPVCTQEY